MNKLDINKEIDNNNKIIIKIFNLVKMQDWKNLYELIKSNKIEFQKWSKRLKDYLNNHKCMEKLEKLRNQKGVMKKLKNQLLEKMNL